MSRLPALHICNTFFESELESSSRKPLASWMRSHPIVRKLQTLPLLYASPEDLILVTDFPPGCSDPRLCLIDAPIKGGNIENWGASQAISSWALEKKISYRMPDWDTVRNINSKIFSFTHSPQLPYACLLHDEKEVCQWIKKTPGPKVLKTPFGTAGRGHFHLSKDEGEFEAWSHPQKSLKSEFPIPGKRNLDAFLTREFRKKRPLIGEPWVERILDFSTQWKDGKLLGAAIFENTPSGSYRSTLVSSKLNIFGDYEWALEKHLEKVQPLLEKMQKLGFSGHLGIDAFIYKWEGKNVLQPIVEINGRKTMSWLALHIQQMKYPSNRLRLTFSPDAGISLALA